MIDTKDIIFNTPARTVTSKAELFISSAKATASGKELLVIDNIKEEKHKVAVKLSSKNLFNDGAANITKTEDYFKSNVGYWEDAFYSLAVEPNETYIATFMIRTEIEHVWGAELGVGIGSLPTYGQGRIAMSLIQNESYQNFATHTIGFTVPADVHIVYFQTDTEYKFKNFQIEKGNSATAYAPYVADFSDCKVKVRGKNLVDMKNPDVFPTGGRFEIIDDNTVRSYGCSGYGNATLGYRIYAPKGTNLTVTFDYELGGEATGTWNIWHKGSGSGSVFNSGNTISVGEEGYIYITFARSGGSGNNLLGWIDVKNLQVEIGTTATDYEPYIGAEYTAAADGTVAGVMSIYPNMYIQAANAYITAEYKSKATDITTFTYKDALKEATIERIGEESKFFGFGVAQKLNLKLLDKERVIKSTTAHSLQIYFGSNENNYISQFPVFNITETNRDEKTNTLSITAYDALKTAAAHTVAELSLNSSYTLGEFAASCAEFLGLELDIQGLEDTTVFNTEYANGANFEGTETVREALNAVAEATQTIYFVNATKLIFKRLGGAINLTIDKSYYITLDSGDNRRLAAICSATELGDNVEAKAEYSGTTQYVRDNPFWELREDIDSLVDAALAAVGGMKIGQFTCNWRGNYGLEIGDTIGLVTKDDTILSSYVINDVMSYNGGFSQVTQWHYTDNETESLNNPTSLGEALKQTFAKVDKQNKQIEIVASETSVVKDEISNLKIDTNSIKGTITDIETEISNTNETLSTLTQQVEAQITEEDVTIRIQSELANGVDKVTTGKGFTLNDEGLTVEDINPNSNNTIKTTISNNGMTVYNNNKETLKANDEGVVAVDLHAKTYLIIGTNSRFEDYGNNRTGCFWIG